MKKKVYPKYSVLMSVYYKETAENLKFSVDSMLNQTIPPSEFILVEDGKLTDELYSCIDEYKKKYGNIFSIVSLDENNGAGVALATGIEKSKNEYIARLDSDDYSLPDRVEKQFEIMEKYPDVSIVGSNAAEFENDIKDITCYVILPEFNEDIIKFSKKRCPFRSAVLYKKSDVIKAGNYSSLRVFEDYDLYIRMIENGCKSYNIQEFLSYVRVSPDFYKRRGGLEYLKVVLSFKNRQLKSGYYSISDYIVSVVPHVIVSLIPNTFRDWIYRNLLRRKKKNEKN